MSEQQTVRRPNILFFFADDQRFDTIQALGNDAIQTPNLDKLVARGTTFTHAFIPGGTSPAVCMPSRAMLHTGRTLFHLEGAGERIPAEHILLGEHLQAFGYQTFGTGKWHNGPDSYARSFSAGAEIFFGGMDDHWNVPAFDYDPTGQYDATFNQCVDPWLSKTMRIRLGDHVTAGKHSSELFADAAVEFLGSYKSSDPLFMYIAFMAPHDPRVMPDEIRALYDPEIIALPENFMGGHPFDNGDLKVRDELLADFPRDPDEIREHIADYYAMITHLDAQIGNVLEMLEYRGMAENTVIIFAGDNGLALGQHGLMGKQNLYDHSVRVPLTMAGPGIPRNHRCDEFAYLLDIFPTLCHLLDISLPESVDGSSLLPGMRGEKGGTRDAVYLAYTNFQRAVRDHHYKLIEYAVNGRLNTQLFDLREDPLEMNNLAEDPGLLAERQRLRAELLRLCEEWSDRETVWGARFWSGWESTKS